MLICCCCLFSCSLSVLMLDPFLQTLFEKLSCALSACLLHVNCTIDWVFKMNWRFGLLLWCVKLLMKLGLSDTSVCAHSSCWNQACQTPVVMHTQFLLKPGLSDTSVHAHTVPVESRPVRHLSLCTQFLMKPGLSDPSVCAHSSWWNQACQTPLFVHTVHDETTTQFMMKPGPSDASVRSYTQFVMKPGLSDASVHEHSLR